LLLAHSLIYEQAFLVHKYLKIPLIGIALSPQFPTKKFKSTFAFGDYFEFDAVKNLESWETMAKIRGHWAKQIYQKYTEEWKITKVDSPLGWLWDFWYKDKIPIISAFSPQIIGGAPEDWPDYVKCVGYFDLLSGVQLKLDSHIEEWLNKEPHSKPIVMTFGSMSIVEPRYVLTLANAVSNLMGVRVIVVADWSKYEINEPRLSDKILFTKGAPFNLLFPRCLAVVHHGGAGTIGASLKAGCPQVVVNFFADQPFWGECIWKIGVGPKPLQYRSLREEDLIDAIRFALRDEIIEKAEEISTLVRNEDGVKEAVKIIDKVFEAGRLFKNENNQRTEIEQMERIKSSSSDFYEEPLNITGK